MTKPSIFLIIALLFCVSAGCGISDYEQQMDRHYKRLGKLDREDSLIGAPLKMLGKVTKDAYIADWPVTPFFRAPKPFKIMPENPKEWYGQDLKLRRYSHAKQKNINLFFATALIRSDKAKDKKSKRKPGEFSQGEFQKAVIAALTTFHQQVYKRIGQFEVSKVTFPEYTSMYLESANAKLRYRHFRFVEKTTNGVAYSFYLHASSKGQAAIVFHTPAQQQSNPDWRKQIAVSLSTLALGADATIAEQEYVRTHPF